MHKLFNKIAKMKKSRVSILSILILLLIGFLDWITGDELSISILYLIPVALCAWFVHKWAGIILSFISVTTWFLSDLFSSSTYSHPIIPYWNSLIMLGIFMIVSLLISTLKSVFDRENSLGLSIQKSLLPEKSPVLPGFKIFSVWQPTSIVSGDYYDFILLSKNNLGISLADVCGHGFPAALLMSNLQASFRIIAGNNCSPREICNRLNKIFVNYKMPDKFISFFYGALDVEKSIFIYSNAGHPPPLVIRNTGEIYRLSVGGLLFGVIPELDYEQESVHLEGGDVILLFTDGIVETRNSAGEEFGENRLISFYKENRNLSDSDFSKKILSLLNEFSNGGIDDDITLVVVAK